MQIVCGAAALAVAGLYYVWRAYDQVRRRRRRRLHEHVAYLLWVLAEEGDDEPADACPRRPGDTDFEIR